MPTNRAARSVNRDSQAKEMNAQLVKPAEFRFASGLYALH